MRGLLLIEGRHAELLVNKRLVLAATGPVTVVSIVAEGWLVQVSKLGHDCVDTAEEALIFLDHVELVGAATQSSDGLAEVLGQNLKRTICLLSTDEDLTNYINQSSG